MPLLSNDGFLTKLAQLFSDSSARGSVWITIKQGEYNEIACVPEREAKE
jgi:Signal recognition particle 14kD protein